MSLPIHQEHGWSRVGAQGRHKHVPSQPGTPNSTPLHDCQISLLALPATALASIFQHLDSVDSFNLAQTCHTCATEFAHQKADFAQKFWRELALTVTRDPPRGDYSLYGTQWDPVDLHVQWEKNPGSALRRFYAISQRPDCVDVMNELWRQAWPEALWSDVLRDGLLCAWPAVHSEAHNRFGCSKWGILLCINIEFQISSDEPLQLPWDWFAKTLLYAPAAGLRHHLNATAPQQMQEDLHNQHVTSIEAHESDLEPARTRIQVHLHRPAQNDQLQEIMFKDLYYYPGNDVYYYSGCYDDWEYDPRDSYYAQAWAPPHVEVCGDLYRKPCHEQKVAITGSWCQALPDASVTVSYARYKSDSHGRHMTLGDDMMVDLKDTAAQLEDSWWAHFGCHVHGVTVGDDHLRHAAELFEGLWRGYFGRHVCGVILHVGDHTIVDLRVLAVHFDHCLDFFTHGFLSMLASCLDSKFEHFSCEVAGQSEWKMKRQQAKQRGKAKSKRVKSKRAKAAAAGRKRTPSWQASTSTSSKASLIHQEIRQTLV